MGRIRWAEVAVSLILACVMTGCGPNVYSVRRTVLNPMHVFGPGDEEQPRPRRLAAICRKDPGTVSANTIVGAYRLPRAMEPYCDIAEIPSQQTDGGELLFYWDFHAIAKADIVELSSYAFRLELPDGRVIKGAIDQKWKYVDLTDKVTGAHMQPHLVVSDSEGTHVYSHVEEVENEYPLFRRKIRIRFEAAGLLTAETPYVTLVIRGYQREWRYRFDFTQDPAEGLNPEDESAGRF